MFLLSLKLMLHGLFGVFIALTILYIAVKSMVKIFPCDAENEK